MASPLAHSDDGRPKKRQRTDQDAAGAQPTIKKSDVVWLSDGNLIIRTIKVPQDSPAISHTLYRVHKSVLAIHCGVFAAMFDGDQAAFEAVSERWEGVPLMELPDVAEDVEVFLDAMYHPKRLREHLPTHGYGDLYDYRCLKFPAFYTGILALATKYDAQAMREQVITALTMLWPKTCSDWDEAESILGAQYREPGRFIRLATTYHIPHVLPALFYDLARATEASLSTMDPEERAVYEEDLALLLPGEMRRLILGKVALREVVEAQAAIYKGSDSPCLCAPDRTPGCIRKGRTWWEKRARNLAGPDWLKALQLDDNFIGRQDEKSVCYNRRKSLTGWNWELREEIWAALPAIFGIPVW
ncbi:hypothetical protein FA95DRAFT_1607274 [Auriscalpium vulgare]|uniref:Uncharacterized protein n=1 Tax=Auriscalpium vulgare TaxID=40419 RepID=A0ACB8RPP6_9AGAM|nr:hypothetical protein FA95DRAFT_1607274 [Auriscalpium vulgare]